MDNTILSALITLASGAIGAASGFFSVLISSKYAAKAQMQQAIALEALQLRSEAYREVFIAEAKIRSAIDQQSLIDALAQFEQAVAYAKTLSSAETAAAFILFEDQVKGNVKNKRIFVDYNGITIAMQYDMNTFTVPKARRNIWTKPQRMQQAKPGGNQTAHKSQRR